MKIKKIRFNAIDFIILIAIIAALFAAVYRSGLKESIVAVRSNETIVYTLKINNVQRRSFDMLEIEDAIYNQSDDRKLGKIVAKEFTDAESYIVLDSGEIIKTTIPERVDIVLTVEATGRVSEDGCMIGGNYFIAAGKYISAYTGKVSFNFEVLDAYKKT